MRLNCVVPDSGGFIEHPASQRNDPGVVHEYVDTAKYLFYLLYGRSQCGSIGNVEPGYQRGSTDALQFSKHKAIFFVVAREHGHGCAGASQAQ